MSSNISVVVPFYNRADKIPRLIDSIKSQSLQPDAVYIVDNGSLISEINEVVAYTASAHAQFLVIFVSTIHRGNANFARNLGMQLAETDLVAFLDSDDWWAKEHLMESKTLLTRSNKAGVYSGSIIHAEYKSINKSVDVNGLDNPFEIFYSKKGRFVAQTSSFLIDKRRVGDVIWDPALKRHQDYDFFLSVYFSGGWAFNSKSLVNFDRENSTQKRNFHFKSMIRFVNKWRPLLRASELQIYYASQIKICRLVGAKNIYLNYYLCAYKKIFGLKLMDRLIFSRAYFFLYILLKRVIEIIFKRVRSPE